MRAVCSVAVLLGVLTVHAGGQKRAAGTVTPQIDAVLRSIKAADKGQLAVIGRGSAVADLGRLHFGGFFAWLAWIFVHIFFLIGFRNRLLVLIQWAYSYFTYRRGARLITGEVGPGTPTRPLRELPTRPPEAAAAATRERATSS